MADIVSESDSGEILVWVGGPEGPAPSPWFRGRPRIDRGAWGSLEFAGDVNGDGFGDVVYGEGVVLLGGESGLSLEPLRGLLSRARGPCGPAGCLGTMGAESEVSLVPIGDLDRDGYADVVFAWSMEEFAGCSVRTSSQRCPYLYRGLDLGVGGPQGYLPHALPLGRGAGRDAAWWIFGPRASGDVDGDGYSDVVTEGKQSATVSFGGVRGAQLVSRTIPGRYLTQDPEPVTDLMTADVNGDGATDVVTFDGDSLWLFAGGARSLTASLVARSLSSEGMTSLLAVGDFDGDGFSDVLGAVSGAGATHVQRSAGERTPLMVFRGTPGGLLQGRPVPLSGSVAPPVLVADFNGDARDDVASPGQRVWLSTGPGFGEPIHLATQTPSRVPEAPSVPASAE